MTEPIRLRDGANAELRELMRYAQAHGAPSPARVEALTASVLAALSGSPPAPAAATSWVATKWLIGAALILALGGVAYRRLEQPSTQPARAPERELAAVAAPIATQATEPAAQEQPVRAPEPEAKAPARARAKPPRASRRIEAGPPVPTNPAEEIALLSRARRALASDPEGALALAVQHQREHPAGAFAEEREAIAVEALWRTGDVGRASKRLRAMLLAYPRSSYRERLTTLIARPLP